MALNLKEYHCFLKTWNIEADVFYDRSPDNECEDGEIIEKKNRPFLLISGTSWTEDEDFSILLNALDIYDEESCANTSLPDLICVITGKGPHKTYYQEIISERCWTRVSVILPWLTTEDYRRMVSSADVGVSLHTSSSQLDLPMKIIDLFGCCVPVLAVSFKCNKFIIIRNYKHARDLIAIFGDLEITVQFLTEIDQLVQLIESPIFAYLRLELLDTGKNEDLVKSLYGLLMLLLQSDAFHLLRKRLQCVPNLKIFSVNGSISSSETSTQPIMDFKDLLKHFLDIQEKHKTLRKRERIYQNMVKIKLHLSMPVQFNETPIDLKIN
uniref:Vacuolar protein 14 C-terminal Fig4-binding domain-containing protein n=1 Tax=Tetranychus urticae TaxID=32264 RepID=T1KW61_TETUR